MKTVKEYKRFEQGPIRPPSEASSLLIRVTRNCPWNKCSFCSVYKDRKFSLRPVDHVIKDIDLIHKSLSMVTQEAGNGGMLTAKVINEIAEKYFSNERDVFYTAVNWMVQGEGSVFLQDANSLIMKPDDLTEILNHLMDCFPWITRITSYARSHTINRMSDEKLDQLAAAGLNRIHIGMESGSDKVLEKINKGVTKQKHIAAGKRVKRSGIELSEYVMPGMGGTELSEEHALETADALNQINADYIRLRTLAVIPGTPLHELFLQGEFVKCTDIGIIEEIRLFIENLEGITSTFKSDHFRNLLQDVEGKLPDQKENMLQILDQFLHMSAEEQAVFQLGRRTGYFHALTDLQSSLQREQVMNIYRQWNVTPDTVDNIIENNIRPSM